MLNTISQKIDAYAQANLKKLKQEEAKTGKHLTKYDIAERMVKNKKLTSSELNSWLKTTEGNKECSLSAVQKNALKNTSAWTIAGFAGVNNDKNTHYTARLENASKKAAKNPVEKQNAISRYHIKLNETVAERKKKYAEMQKEIKQQQATNQILDPNQALNEQKFKDHISSLPEVDTTYTELMNDIKFQNMDKKQKTEFLLKTTGQKFYEAKERGDKEAMKEYLYTGVNLVFEILDQKLGIRDIKEAVKKYSGLNTVVDAIDKFVDDSDDTHADFKEKIWAVIKSFGNLGDGLIGTKGIVASSIF